MRLSSVMLYSFEIETVGTPSNNPKTPGYKERARA